MLTYEIVLFPWNAGKPYEIGITTSDEFFKMIGVNEDLADEDAEGIEHHLHTETLEKLEEFVKGLEVPEKKI